MWIMTTDFSELTPRQTRRVVRFTEPMFLTRRSPRADWRDAKLRGKTLFVVRHFVTLMAGTARACSAVFETCRQSRQRNRQRIFKEWRSGRFSREKQSKLALLSMARINAGNTMNGMKRRRREQNKTNRKHCTAICLSLLVLKVVVVEFLLIYLSCLWVTFS